MDDIWVRLADNMADRISGPMKFRFILQPAMACFFAVRSGLNDARAGKPPYFWSLIDDPLHRTEMLQDGWKSVGKVFMLAIVLDVIYQVIALRFVYPGEALLVALLLAILPYLIVRGLVTRLTRHP
jgi:hypothetical protein